MAEVTHLPADSSTAGIIEVIERDGVAIVDGFIESSWLDDFNTAVQTSVDNFVP